MEKVAEELGFESHDLTSLYGFLCEPPRLQLIVDYLLWSDPKIAGDRFSSKSDIIQGAINAIVSKNVYYTTMALPSNEIRPLFTQLDNDILFVVKFVALQRKEVWSARLDNENVDMCKAALGVLRAIQSRLLKAPINYDNNPLLIGLVRAAPQHNMTLDELFQLPEHIKEAERQVRRTARPRFTIPANAVFIDLSQD
ncbi:hypothetical protein DL95DRAFT_460520 [Leptodontidium sp. 2 PMI_412]|nr:hypothetical protein DL95DRAFT_460520 [Leptodontidium sp. 2 PMI_412]